MAPGDIARIMTPTRGREYIRAPSTAQFQKNPKMAAGSQAA